MFNILNLIYPNVCGICNTISKKSICNKCYIKTKKLEKIYKLDTFQKNFDDGYSLFKYDGIIRNKIIDYKFNSKSYLYKTFLEIFLNNKKIYRILKKYDIIIPVPIASIRKLKRGYNQTELVASFLAKNVGIEYRKNVLKKTKNIIAQSKLSRDDRIKNVQGAFKIKNGKVVVNKNIILFDDIYTTGSTVNECARILKEAKANSVCVLTIAKD